VNRTAGNQGESTIHHSGRPNSTSAKGKLTVSETAKVANAKRLCCSRPRMLRLMAQLSLILPVAFSIVPVPESAPAASEHAAKVISLTGEVFIMKDSVPRALKSGDAIPARQLVITGSDGFALFQVSDGSIFEGFPNSRVAFRGGAGNWTTVLNQWLRHARGHIHRFEGQSNRDRVRTPTAVIAVRG
jgi:hypothetical protein